MVFLRVHRHAAGAHDFQRLERVAAHDHVLRRPVRARDRVLVLVALVLGGVHGARLEAHADLRHRGGLRHPEVDHVDAGVAADHEEVAPRGRHARDVHGVAGLDDRDDLLRVAVDEGDLARVAQRGGEDVVDVVAVLLGLRALLHGHLHAPGRLHLRQAELGRLGRRLLHVARHHVDLVVVQLARSAPVGHARGRAVLDEDLEVVGSLVDGDVGREGLAGGALPQHAVAACAALEKDLAGVVELRLRHGRRLGVDVLVHRDILHRRGTCLVADLDGIDLLGFLRRDLGVLSLRERAGGDCHAGDCEGDTVGRAHGDVS